MKKLLLFIFLTFPFYSGLEAQCLNNIYAGYGGYGYDYGQVIVTDSSENVYICGFFTDSIQLGVFNLLTDSLGQFLCKISPAGVVLWAKSLYNNDGVSYYPPVLKLDYSGQLIVAGTCQTTNADFDTIINAFINGDLFISKFDVNTGDLKSFISTGRHLYSYITDIDMDSSENLYLVGMFVGVINFDSLALTCTGQTNSFIVKYDSLSKAVWAQRITTFPNSTGNRTDNIDYDLHNNIFVSGWYGINAGFGNGVTLNSPTYTNGFIAKYDLNGNVKWAKSSDTNTVFIYQAINDTADIAVVQASPDKIVRYNQKGDTISTKIISASVSGSTFSKFILANGKYYTSGNFYNSVTINDSVYSSPGANIFIASILQNGTTENVTTISSTGTIAVYDFVVDSQEDLFLTGLYGHFDTLNQTISMPGWGDVEVLFIKRCNNPTVVPAVINEENKILVFPNPASSNINVILYKNERVIISNVLGESLIEKNIITNSPAKVEIDISFLPQGIYFIRSEKFSGKFIKQ